MRFFAAFAAILVMFAIADTATAQVRYSVAGTALASEAASQAPQLTARAAGLRLLSWPGKVAPAVPAPRAAYRPAGYARAVPQVYAQPAYTQPAYAQPAYGAPAAYAPPAPQGPPAPPLPASIYAAPQAQAEAAPALAPHPAQPVAMAALTQPAAPYGAAYAPDEAPAHARFYSVHSAYGEKADPIQMSPQFFGASADLAQPPPPVARQVTTSSGQVVRATATSSADDPTSPDFDQ